MAGWIKLHRMLIEKPIWKCSTQEQKVILITLLLMVNHEEKEWEWQGEKYIVQPGQCITSLKSIAEKAGIGISIQNVRTAIDKFEKYEFLTNKSTNKNRLITIVNWDVYQLKEDELTSKATSSQQAANKQLTTNKNVKNDIETLNMFYNPQNDFLILNHHNKQFDFYKILSESYLDFDLEQREIFKDSIKGKNIETINLLDEVVRIRKKQETTKKAAEIQEMLRKQSIDAFIENYEIIQALRDIEILDSDCFFDYNPFVYGYIQGIRAERAKRKGKVHHSEIQIETVPQVIDDNVIDIEFESNGDLNRRFLQGFIDGLQSRSQKVV